MQVDTALRATHGRIVVIRMTGTSMAAARASGIRGVPSIAATGGSSANAAPGMSSANAASGAPVLAQA